MDIARRPATGPSLRIDARGFLTQLRKRRWLAIVAALFVVALVVTSTVVVRSRLATSVAYVSVPVLRRDLVQSVTATGTINPQNTVAVGTQESGTVAQVLVDFNSHVKRGQILARLDPTTFQAALDQERAILAQTQAQARAASSTALGAQASIGTANATQNAALATARGLDRMAASNEAGIAAADSNIQKARSALVLAQATVGRDSALLAQGYIAQSQSDTDRTALVAAQSALDAARSSARQAQLGAAASLDQAQASSAQSTAQSYGVATAQSQAATQAANADAVAASVSSVAAQVRQAELNLDKTIIRSPVDGTVVARNVSVGTTVAASLQTPTLFSIAQDLNKMEADVSVGEPDIGNVRASENVNFSVLAFPNRTFRGTVAQVRINPVTTSNVVTYTTVVLVDNRDGALLPGMTASASIDVAKAPNALVVPLAALAYRPPSGTVTGTRRHRAGTGAATASGAGAGSAGASSPWGATSGSAAAVATVGSRGRIFVQRGGALVAIPVSIALVSGTEAAVTPTRGPLTTDDLVVTGDSTTDSASASKRSASGGNPLTGGGGPGRGATRGIGG